MGISKQKGFIVPTILISVTFIATIALYILSLSISNQKSAANESYRQNAQFVADAGLDVGIQSMNIDTDWTGTAGEITLYDDGVVKTTYQTTVTDGATDEEKTLTTIGRVYNPATSSTPKVVRKYELDIKAVTSGTGPASVVSGVGGLILNNNSKISGGDVVVNGKITMNNNSQIGLTTNAVNVRVAHQSCPIPADNTYPRVCNSGENGEPISMGTNAKIYGNVQATNQTTGTNMSNPGLIAGSTYPPITLPAYDRDGQKAAVATTLPSSDSTIACGNNQSKTWPANVKVTGNITLGNNCTVTITGNTWITGNVTMGNNAKFKMADSLGTTRPTIMIDGGNSSGTGGFVFGNNAQIVPNASNTGTQIITYWSAASCSPDCADVTGTDLYNSQGIQTLVLSNNGSAQNTILWARWTKVSVSNNGALGAVTGQTVQLGNNAVISFTASIPGSDNLVITWVKRGYLRVFQ